jgi:hypothetical protein
MTPPITPAHLQGPLKMKPAADAKPSELEQAAADRRSFGNPGLAANAEFKVMAEALRELVSELRMIRTQMDKLVAAVSHSGPVAPP